MDPCPIHPQPDLCDCYAHHDQKTRQFVAKHKAKYGDHLNYFFTLYENEQTPLLLLCSLHVPFRQLPREALNKGRKNACPECGKKKSTAQFIKDAQRIHGLGQYSYQTSVYLSCAESIDIYCRDHGLFRTTPTNWLRKEAKCPYCPLAKKRVSLVNKESEAYLAAFYNLPELLASYPLSEETLQELLNGALDGGHQELAKLIEEGLEKSYVELLCLETV